MSKLAQLKQRLASIQPFVVFTFKGVADRLVVDDLPLSVAMEPASASFIIESNEITTTLLRYSDTFKNREATIGAGGNLETKTELATTIMKEVVTKMEAKEDSKLEMISIIAKLARAYMTTRAIKAWYGDVPTDSFEINFTETQLEANKLNEQHAEDDYLAVAFDSLNEMEIIGVGMELMSALETEKTMNVPIADTITDADGNTQEGVITDSVPAKAVTAFPRNTRSIALEDVRPDPAGEVGNNS